MEQKKNRSGGSREALLVMKLANDEEIAKKLTICQQVSKEKMKKLGILLTGKDTNFGFCPSYGQRIRKNIIQENDLQDSDDEHNALEEGNSSDETECDSYDLQV